MKKTLTAIVAATTVLGMLAASGAHAHSFPVYHLQHKKGEWNQVYVHVAQHERGYCLTHETTKTSTSPPKDSDDKTGAKMTETFLDLSVRVVPNSASPVGHIMLTDVCVDIPFAAAEAALIAQSKFAHKAFELYIQPHANFELGYIQPYINLEFGQPSKRRMSTSFRFRQQGVFADTSEKGYCARYETMVD